MDEDGCWEVQALIRKANNQELIAMAFEFRGRALQLFFVRLDQVPQQLVPFLTPFLVGRYGSPTKIDYRKKGTLILTSLLEDVAKPILLISSEANPTFYVLVLVLALVWSFQKLP